MLLRWSCFRSWLLSYLSHGTKEKKQALSNFLVAPVWLCWWWWWWFICFITTRYLFTFFVVVQRVCYIFLPKGFWFKNCRDSSYLDSPKAPPPMSATVAIQVTCGFTWRIEFMDSLRTIYEKAFDHIARRLSIIIIIIILI